MPYKDPNKIKEYSKMYYQTHKVESKAYYEKNKEAIKARRKKRKQRSPNKF